MAELAQCIFAACNCSHLQSEVKMKGVIIGHIFPVSAADDVPGCISGAML